MSSPIELLQDAHHERADLVLIHRAVVSGWAVRDELLRALPELCTQIALDGGQQTRDRLRAIEILRAMWADRVNVAIESAKLEARDTLSAADVEEIRASIMRTLIDEVGSDAAEKFVRGQRAAIMRHNGNGQWRQQ